jgi:hypothetical protein
LNTERDNNRYKKIKRQLESTLKTINDNYEKLFVIAHKNAAHCIGEQNKS